MLDRNNTRWKRPIAHHVAAARARGGSAFTTVGAAAARPPPKMALGIKTNYQHRSCRDRHGRSQRGCARRRPVVRFVNASGSIQKKSASTTSANVSTLMPIPTSTATDPCAHDTGGDLSPLSTSVHWVRLAISATPPRAPGARRVLRLEPRLRRPAAVWRIRPLRDNALQPHAADVLEHGRAVTRQMFNELDGAPLGPADLSPPPG